MSTAQTALNPSDQESMPAALQKLLRDFSLDFECCLPVRVVSYDRVTNLATVKPIVDRLTVSNEAVPRNEIIEVQVLAIGGGGFMINFPLVPGDLGWIDAADRDLDNFKETLESGPPATCRTHSFSDSRLIPDVFRKYTILGEHSEEAVIQSTNGNTRIALGQNRIKVAVGDAHLEVTDGKVTLVTQGEFDVQSASSKFSGSVEIGENLTVSGATAANGGFAAASGMPCTLPSEATAGGVKVHDHDHVSSSPGQDTGPMKAG